MNWHLWYNIASYKSTMNTAIKSVLVLTGSSEVSTLDKFEIADRLLSFFEGRDSRAILTIATDDYLRKYYENAIGFLANQLEDDEVSYQVKIRIVGLLLKTPFNTVTTSALIYSAIELYKAQDLEMVSRILNRFTLLVSAHPMGDGLPSGMSSSDLILDANEGVEVVNSLVLYLIRCDLFLDTLESASTIKLTPVHSSANTLVNMLSNYRRSYLNMGYQTVV